jgi:hypothetical protein
MENNEITKQAIMQIQQWLRNGVVTPEDLNMLKSQDNNQVLTRRLHLSEIFYYLGALIIFLGISVLVGQNWEALNSITRVLLTLGAGVVFYVVGVALVNNKISDKISVPFFLLSGFLIPSGLYILFDSVKVNSFSVWLHTFIWGISFLFFWLSEVYFRKIILTLFTCIFGLFFFFALTDWVLGAAELKLEYNYFAYRVLTAGFVYLILGYIYQENNFRSVLVWFLNLAGLGMFLGASMYVGGFKPEQNIFWELLFPFLAFGAIYLSTIIKSRAYLIIGTLFLMGYFGKITTEYFSDSLGWPITLIVIGLLMIGIGYWSVQINRKYFKV